MTQTGKPRTGKPQAGTSQAGTSQASDPLPLPEATALVAAELGVPDGVVDLEAVLDLARDAAHEVRRPMAPVATFLAGYLAAAPGADTAAAFQQVRAAIARVAADAAGAPDAGETAGAERASGA